MTLWSLVLFRTEQINQKNHAFGEKHFVVVKSRQKLMNLGKFELAGPVRLRKYLHANIQQYHNRHQDFSQIWNYYQYSWVWVQLGPQLSVTQIVKWEFSICCRILVLVESEFFELGSLLWRLIYTGDFRAFLQAQCPRSFSCVADGQEIAPGSYKDYDKCQTINCYCNPRVKHDSLDSPTARVEACQLSYSYGVVLVLS